jgi:hypothetical protein
MPYNRRYNQAEVHDILCASERRVRPAGGTAIGHPITQHGDGRGDILDKRHKSVILLHESAEQTRQATPIPSPTITPDNAVPKDSRFLSRLDLVRAVTQALNSTAGQFELSKLTTQRSVTIKLPLDRSLGIQAEAAAHPTATVGTGHAARKIETAGPSSHRQGVASGVIVVVDRVRVGDPDCAIHIHTAYPSAVV